METTTTTPSPPTVKKMPDLLTLLGDYQERRGVARLMVMTRLRAYVLKTPQPLVLEQIQRIHDVKHLKVLIGVGMRGVLYHAVVAQLARNEGLI